PEANLGHSPAGPTGPGARGRSPIRHAPQARPTDGRHERRGADGLRDRRREWHHPRPAGRYLLRPARRPDARHSAYPEASCHSRLTVNQRKMSPMDHNARTMLMVAALILALLLIACPLLFM